jgi:hypothetical protein
VNVSVVIALFVQDAGGGPTSLHATPEDVVHEIVISVSQEPADGGDVDGDGGGGVGVGTGGDGVGGGVTGLMLTSYSSLALQVPPPGELALIVTLVVRETSSQVLMLIDSDTVVLSPGRSGFSCTISIKLMLSPFRIRSKVVMFMLTTPTLSMR